MKKLISLVLALMMCFSAFGVVLADEFVPSISYKDGPELVTGEDENGKTTIGAVVNGMGNVEDYVYANDCLVVTTIAEALRDADTGIPDEAEEELEYVYREILEGRMEVPFNEPTEMAIIQLLDASMLCGGSTTGTDHDAMLKNENTFLEVTFRLGVDADVPVTVMVYVDGQWVKVTHVVNNGDGTVTCSLKALGPIVFAIPADKVETPATGDNSAIGLWVGLMAASSVALAALLIFRRKIVC